MVKPVINDKELVLNIVREMPETVSFREIVDELLLVEEVRKRLEKNPHGNGVPHEEVVKMLNSWIAKPSPAGA